MVQLWFSCGVGGLLCDGCGSVWFRSGLAWCGIVHLRFSFGSAWHGMIVYGSVWIMWWLSFAWLVIEQFSFGSALVKLWVQ